MRIIHNTILTAALLASVAVGGARASDAPKDKGAGNSMPSESPSGGASAIGAAVGPTNDSLQQGTTTDSRWGGMLDIGKKGNPKWWEIGATWETHGMLIQNDLEGAAANKLFNYMFFYARADITANNRLSIRGGFSERFIADQTETGLRFGDMSLTYSRRVPLPKEFTLRLGLSVALPTSYISQKASMIAAPTLSVAGSRKFGWVSADARLFATYYFMQYSSYGGGSADPMYAGLSGGAPNERFALGGFLDLEISPPQKYLNMFALGADVYDEYVWFYNVGSGGAYGAVQDTQFPTQPIQQAYGGEVYLRFTPPSFAGVNTSLTIAYANGDPALGYNSVIHDGIAHVYGFWRLNSEIYGALSASY